VYLTMIGGGAFGNSRQNIYDSIFLAHQKWGKHEQSKLKVRELIFFCCLVSSMIFFFCFFLSFLLVVNLLLLSLLILQVVRLVLYNANDLSKSFLQQLRTNFIPYKVIVYYKGSPHVVEKFSL
jgi:hypothetical protein